MRIGLRPEDLVVNLVEVKRENWSFGSGEAQLARRKQPGAPPFFKGEM
jgi:hypothetical protein